ncbi:Malonyl-CoA decarboxylase, mitochondrial [Hypsibius exemplaris]|uniref:Malonyl-CoA decarboxylase, mitochondrial n=1 Tax=Hypsibius exemplaris TaxID=2072580 RepID=A0A1W0XC86_HYPEX|nr:Malonyl-CoA decarboxylase, mitochondrial [Hypsibius exemplaris]
MHNGNGGGRDSSHGHNKLIRHGYGDPPAGQLEARLFSSRSEAADIMTALELGYKDQTSSNSSKSFGKNLTRYELASRICEEFPHYSEKDQTFFIISLAKQFGVDNTNVRNAAKSLTQHTDNEMFLKIVEKFKESAVPTYQEIFKDIGKRSGGVKFLVDLRGTVLEMLDIETETDNLVALRFLNNSLRDLLGLWFSGGMMNLERITWQSPCEVLEKISQYEAVHPVRHWTDIKHRVGPYRRCFVFTHSCMPGEPVVVLHTALMEEIGDNVQQILRQNRTSEVEDPDKIRAAVFYSVSSTQKGLRGIDLGMYLIKRAVADMRREFPEIVDFSTLSPIPTFAAWLLTKVRSAETIESLMTEPEVLEWNQLVADQADEQDQDALKYLQMTLPSNWYEDDETRQSLQGFITRMALTYLTQEKRRGFAYDSVENFHLGNGAEIYRLNWLADTSGKGLSQSFGMMVNFRYPPDAELIKNSNNYIFNKCIKVSQQIQQMLATFGLLPAPTSS